MKHLNNIKLKRYEKIIRVSKLMVEQRICHSVTGQEHHSKLLSQTSVLGIFIRNALLSKDNLNTSNSNITWLLLVWIENKQAALYTSTNVCKTSINYIQIGFLLLEKQFIEAIK